MLNTAAPFSLWLQRQIANQTLNLPLLQNWLPRAITPEDFAQFANWQQLQSDGNEAEIARQLRLLRRHVLAHIITRDIHHQADLAEVTRTITQFADFAINIALNHAHAHYQALYGTPIGRHTGAEQHLTVIAMGKAGGYELNVSSDLDLIFTYPESGDTNGKRERSNQEFFTKVGQKLIALLGDITADGQVFRVDMRLRPDGDSGALVASETALEQYLITQGREWERYAWCKARMVTPYANDIAALVRPFVFRKYLDYNAYHAMRELHRQIKQEVKKRGMENNIKLGAGGIREIEFIAQIFQMIRGGQNRSLQLKGTQETLVQLGNMGILPQDTIAQLLAAYRFLRDVEHRLQYWDDQQTQTLPDSPEQQTQLAISMGFADYPTFLGSLKTHRNFVNQQFNQILNEPEHANNEAPHPLAELWDNAADPNRQPENELAKLGYADSHHIAERLAHIRQGSKYRQLSAQAQPRFDAIVPRMIEAAAHRPNPDATLLRLLDFLDSISRRSAYLAFLQQYFVRRTPIRPTDAAAGLGSAGKRTRQQPERPRRHRKQNGHPAPLPTRANLPPIGARFSWQMDSRSPERRAFPACRHCPTPNPAPRMAQHPQNPPPRPAIHHHRLRQARRQRTRLHLRFRPRVSLQRPPPRSRRPLHQTRPPPDHMVIQQHRRRQPLRTGPAPAPQRRQRLPGPQPRRLHPIPAAKRMDMGTPIAHPRPLHLRQRRARRAI